MFISPGWFDINILRWRNRFFLIVVLENWLRVEPVILSGRAGVGFCLASCCRSVPVVQGYIVQGYKDTLLYSVLQLTINMISHFWNLCRACPALDVDKVGKGGAVVRHWQSKLWVGFRKKTVKDKMGTLLG